jgi:hypothetical protein
MTAVREGLTSQGVATFIYFLFLFIYLFLFRIDLLSIINNV